MTRLAEVAEASTEIATTASRSAKTKRLAAVLRAAETEDVTANARAKLRSKGCDLIVANSVADGTSTFGGEANQVQLIDADGVESWPSMSKTEVADRLVRRLATELTKRP